MGQNGAVHGAGQPLCEEGHPLCSVGVEMYQINPRNDCFLAGETRASKHIEPSQRIYRVGQGCLLSVVPRPRVPDVQGHSA